MRSRRRFTRRFLRGFAFVFAAAAIGTVGRSAVWIWLGPAENSAGLLPRRLGGALVICGGAGVPEAARRQFLEFAGGARARVIVIPTASDDADSAPGEFLEQWTRRGVRNVQILHARDRRQADDPVFSRDLDRATGVWIVGGRQSRLAAAYSGTEVERRLQALYKRGGVIGGSSAGAAAMSRTMVLGGIGEAVEGRGIDLLPNAVIDQHFLKRDRMGRLQTLMSRHPELIGFGVDERTALIVHGGRLSVVGESYVVVCLPGAADRPARFEFLKQGDEADLQSLSTNSPRIVSASDLDTFTLDND